MNKIPAFQGSCTAIVTPFCDRGIDYARLERNLEAQYEGGTAAILVCGTTGENATLSQDEHHELVRYTVNACRGKMKTIVGIGGVTTAEAVVEMMLAGATAVEVGAANLRDPMACPKIIARLPEVMDRCGIRELKDITGGAHER